MLGKLLHPHSVADFYASVWERTFLHIRREQSPRLGQLFDDLLDLDDIDALLTVIYAAGPRPAESIRMGQDGSMLPPDQYLSNIKGNTADIDVARVLELHRAGASIILNGVHTVLRPVAEFCQQLSADMGVHVHANIYITPRGAQGFPVHFDSHDVFLLQIAGEKNWRLADSSVPLATFEAQSPEQLTPTGPESNIVLREGEMLYIPRGLLHEGITSNEMSAHLTVGMNPLTWADVLHDLIAKRELTDVALRRSASTGMDRSELREVLLELGRSLLGDDEFVARVVQRLSPGRPEDSPARLKGQLRSLHNTRAITLDSVVRLRSGLAPTIGRTDDDIQLDYGSGRLKLPDYTEPQVTRLCSGLPVRPNELPPGLDDAGRLVLVKRLLREGVLVAA